MIKARVQVAALQTINDSEVIYLASTGEYGEAPDVTGDSVTVNNLQISLQHNAGGLMGRLTVGDVLDVFLTPGDNMDAAPEHLGE